MLKKIILALPIILCLVTSANSQSYPTITYPINTFTSDERVIGDPSLLKLEVATGDLVLGIFNRNLNQVKSILNDDINYYKPHIIVKQNYNIIRFIEKERQNLVGIYILNQQDIIVGYCLISKIGNLKKSVAIETSSTITQMKGLTNNNSYLQSNLIIPGSVTVNFYEQDHGTFIERYCFAEDNNYEALVLDAFYPKEIESDLTNFIIAGLNSNFNDFLLE